MKLLTLLLLPILFSASQPAFAFDSASCQVEAVKAATSEAPAMQVLSCADGSRLEVKVVAGLGRKCSSSFWCSGFDHCVGGQCVPQNMFHQCDMFHSCSFGDKCVKGVCKH